ncbi:hypothetical protein PBI_DRMANHATTAN_73 [Arthrobacter phage DrManhattan]
MGGVLLTKNPEAWSGGLGVTFGDGSDGMSVTFYYSL